MIYSSGRGLNVSPGFDDPTYGKRRTTDMKSVHKMKSENIKDYFKFCPYLGSAPHCQPSLKGNKKASQ